MRKLVQMLMPLVAIVAMALPLGASAQVTVPYTTGFEAADDTAWTFVNDATNQWAIGTATASGGTSSLYVTNNGGTGNAYTNSGAQFSYAYRAVTISDAGQYAVSFDWKGYGESNYDYLRAWLAPDTAATSLTAGQDPEGGSSAYSYRESTPAGWFDLGGKMNLQNSWQTTTAMPVLPAGNYILVFMWANDGSGGSNPPAAVDNISITALTCSAPGAFAVDSVTVDEIYVSWTAGDESMWQISINDSIIDVTTNPYVITDLTLNTPYILMARAVCGSDDTSFWCDPVSTRTLAGAPISEFPYFCGFEYDADNDIDQAANWVLENGTEANPWYVGTAVNNGGSRSLYISNTNGSTNAYTTGTTSFTFAYATFSFEAGEYSYSYDWRANGESSYDFIRAAVVPSTVDITAGDYCGFNNTSAVPAGGVAMDGAYRLNQQSSWQTQIGTFTIPSDGLYKVVFLWRNDGSGGTQPPAAIDNIAIARNTCPAPTNLYASYVGTDTIIVSWSAGGEESTWEVSNGVDPAVEVYDTTYTFENLLPNTQYNIRVRAICDVDDTSLVTTTSVRTNCADVTVLPVTYNFDDQETGSSAPFVYCWDRYCSSPGYNYYPYITSNSTYSHSGSNALYTYFGTGTSYPDTVMAMLPQVDSTLYQTNQMELTFWASTSSSSYHPIFEVGVYVTGEDSSYFVVVDTVDVTYAAGVAEYSVLFNNYVGPQGRVAFRMIRSMMTASYSYCNLYIDDVTIREYNSCVTPANLAVNAAIPDSVALTWSEMGDATGWEIAIGAVGFNPDTVTAIPVTDTSYVFTDLLGGVTYDAYVRANCGGGNSYWAGPITFIPGQYIFGHSGSATITMCGGVVYDEGGPTGQYSNNADFVLTIYPSHPDSMLTFQGWAYTEGSIDYLRIYEGTSPSGNQLWGTSTSSQLDSIPYTVVTSGPITLKWHTDGSVIYDGFELQIGCMAAPECSPVDALTVNPTPTAALVTWQPGFYGNYSGAMVEYKVDTVDSWTALAPVTGNYAVITGLEPLTNYNVRVTTNCDGFMGGVATANFTTKQFSCVVEDTTQVSTGTIGTGTSETSGVPVNSAWGNTMCQSIYLASELTAMGMGNTITSITYTWTNNSTYAKEFSIYMTNTSASEFTSASTSNWQPTGASALVYNGQHPVGTSGSVTYQLATPFVWDGSSNICITTTMNQPAGVSHTSSGFYGKSTETSPQVYRTMYKYQDSNPLDGSNPASVTPSSRSYNRPNITLSSSGCSQYGTCAAPAVAVAEVTTSTATLAWAPGNTETSWNLYYRMAGETSWSAPVAVTGSSYTVNGLTQGRKYEFKLENACTEGAFATTTEATLLCATISSLPFTENFNGWGTGVTPNCWSNALSYTPTSYGIISSSYNCSGSTGGSVYMYSSSTLTNKTYLVLPEIDTLTYSANQLQLVFNLYHYSTSYGNPAVEVGVMTDPANASTFVTIDTARHSGALNTWEIFEVPLASYTGNGSYIAIRTAYEGTYSYFYLDDVTLEVIPTCPRPDSLTASNSTTSSVDLGWHERGGASSWIIEYGPRGFQPGTGTTVTANSNPFTLTGLPAAFQGEYYVKSICGAGDTGDYSRRPCALETTQIPATLPYNYDFESVTEWQNWQTSTNHATNNWYRGNSVADSGSYAMYIAAGDTATYGNYTFNAVVNAAAYRDIDFGPVDSSYTLSFRARVGGSTDGAYDGLMVFLVDPSIATVASTQGITSPWGNVNDLYRIATVRLDTTWQTYEASFDTISGIHRVAFFWFNQNTISNHPAIQQPAALDNIHIRYSSCVRPVNVEATPGSTTALVTWQGASDGNYEVIYRQYPGVYTNSYANTATNSITLTGLESNSQYAVWVRKVCGVGDTSLTSDGILFTTTMCDGGTEAINFDPNASATTSSYSPIGYSLYNNSYVQTIVDSADLAALNGDITALGFLPTVTTGGDYFTNMTVYMANVPESTLTDFIHPDSTNHVFVKVIDSANFNYTEAEWQIHNLDNAFTWDGHSNLLVAVTREHGSWTSGATFSAHTASGTKMVYDYDDNSAFDINTASGGTTSSTVGDIRLISCGAFVPCNDPVINLTATVANENDVTISFSGDAMQYEVGYVQGNTWVEPATTVTIADTFYTFTGLTAETQYTFGVRARCSETNLSNWSTVTLTTLAHPCFTPTHVAVSNATYDGATVTWTPGEVETEWEVNISCTSPVYNQTFTVSGTPQYVATGLDEGVTYKVAVRGVCAPGRYSDWSDTVDLATMGCDVVTGLTKTSGDAHSVTISWTSTGASKYEVDYGDQGHTDGNGTIVETTTNSITINGLESESTYDIYVRQYCTETLASQWSSMLRITTTAEGIDDVESARVTLYPNPASQMVTIGGIEGEATVSIVDMNGREVYSTNSASESLTLDLTGYAKGAYFVRITGERTQAIRKLIVK